MWKQWLSSRKSPDSQGFVLAFFSSTPTRTVENFQLNRDTDKLRKICATPQLVRPGKSLITFRPEHPLFHEIADIAPVMIWMSGPDKLCNYFNRRWLEFTGRELKEELGNGWVAGVHPDDIERCLKIYEQSFNARESFSMEYRLRRHDGVYRWILDNGRPIHSADKEFAGYAGSCVDITDQKQIQSMLEKSEAQYRYAIEATSDGVWDWNIITGEVNYSPAYYQMLGYEVNEWNSGSVDTWIGLLHPDERDRVVEFAQIKLQNPGYYQIEFRMREKVGSYRWVLSRGKVVERDAAGRPVRAVGTHVDINDLKIAQAELLENKKKIESLNQCLEQTVHERTSQLRKSEGHFRSLVELSPVPLAMNDREGNITFLNRAFVRTYGYTIEEIPTIKDWFELAYPDPLYRKEIGDNWNEAVEHAFANKTEVTPVEVKVRDKKGHDRDVVINASFLDESGKAIVVTLFDITKAKAEEERIRRLGRLYAALSGCQAAMISAKSQSEIFERICDVIYQEGVAKLVWIGVPDHLSKMITSVYSCGEGDAYMKGISVSFDKRDPLGRGPTGTAVNEGHPVWCQDFAHDKHTKPWHERGEKYGWKSSASLPLYRKGEVVSVLTLYFDKVAYFDNEIQILLLKIAGSISFALDAMADQEAREAAEKQLLANQRDLEQRVIERTAELSAASESLTRSNEEQLAIFDAATIGIALTNNRIIERCNKAMEEIFGYQPGELNGKSTIVIYRDESVFDEVSRNSLSEIAKQGFYREERRVFRKDGSGFWARLSARPLDQNDLTKGLAGTFEDITLERSALEEMERAKILAEETASAKANFLANMSHEIRTPMNAIIGMTHLALNANPEPRIRSFLQKVILSSQHLLGIINDILDFSKIEAGKMPIEHVNFELDTVIDNATGLISESAAGKNLEIIVDVMDDVPRSLIGDPLRIQQILVNFLSNAVKFTDIGEVVIGITSLETDGNDAFLKFSVRDSGVGIPDEKRQHLFESFEQVDSSTTRKYGGTGLGLAIAKRLAEAMGGDIGVESKYGRAGSTFWFTAKLGKSSKQSKPRFKRWNLESRRMLIVDDHPEARQVIESMVRSLGCDTKAAASGKEALGELNRAIAKGLHYDIIFLDWKMPEMDGISVAQRIRQMPLERQPLILMATAYDRDECMRAAGELDIGDVLAKPVTSSSLYNTIMRVLPGIMPSEDASQPAYQADVIKTKVLSGVRALLAEDNDLNQEVAVELLKEFGVIVDVAPNGANAIELANKSDYDVILMDVQMPVMDGLSATKQLRKEPRFRDIPILAMTAGVMKEDQEACISAGMNDHVAKPIDPAQLESILLKWLPNRAITQHHPTAERRVQQTLEVEQVFPDQISGLDTAAGLSRVLGKTDLYHSLLRKFIDGEREAAANIMRAIASGKMLEAERLTHTLKGVSGSIGAFEVQRVAAELETAIRESRSQPQLDKYCEALTQLLADLTRSIERSLPAEAVKAPVQIDAAKIVLVCRSLAQLLADSDVRASDLLAENSELLAAAFPRHYPALKKNIEAFDYEAASTALRDAQMSLS
jgi:two-component system sensor histidine kinase/response regulator